MAHLRWVAALVLGSAALVACGNDGQAANSSSLRVVTAFYPLAFAVSGVGGADVEVEDLTPSGAEPHDLELSSGEVRAIADADLVVYLGGGFQPAVEDVVSGLDPSRVLDALDGLDLMEGSEDEHADEQAPQDGEVVDPHVWLDPVRMAAIVERVADRLAELDEANAETYRAEAEAMSEELTQLDRDYSERLADCKSQEFVTSHTAFSYLAARYDLEQIAIAGIDPEAEPSPARLAEVARLVEEHGITTVFFEELAPPDLAETLSRETGAETDVLSPLETPPESGDYVDVMRSNLDKLGRALGCD